MFFLRFKPFNHHLCCIYLLQFLLIANLNIFNCFIGALQL